VDNPLIVRRQGFLVTFIIAEGHPRVAAYIMAAKEEKITNTNPRRWIGGAQAVFEQLDYLLLYKSFTQPGESFEITLEELTNACSRRLAVFLSRWRVAPNIDAR
jgi:hypothetical protein